MYNFVKNTPNKFILPGFGDMTGLMWDSKIPLEKTKSQRKQELHDKMVQENNKYGDIIIRLPKKNGKKDGNNNDDIYSK